MQLVERVREVRDALEPDRVRHFPDRSGACMQQLRRALEPHAPDQIGPAWEAALAADRPCLIEAITDPDVPPLPPHISASQAAGFLASMLKGDTDTAGIVASSAKQVLASLLPNGKKGE